MNSLKMFTDEQFVSLFSLAGIVQNVLRRERKSNLSQVDSYDRHMYANNARTLPFAFPANKHNSSFV